MNDIPVMKEWLKAKTPFLEWKTGDRQVRFRQQRRDAFFRIERLLAELTVVEATDPNLVPGDAVEEARQMLYRLNTEALNRGSVSYLTKATSNDVVTDANAWAKEKEQQVERATRKLKEDPAYRQAVALAKTQQRVSVLEDKVEELLKKVTEELEENVG